MRMNEKQVRGRAVARIVQYVVIAAMFTASGCLDQKAGAPAIAVENVWSRAAETMQHSGEHAGHSSAQMQVNGVVYFDLHNRGGSPDRLVAVSSPVCTVAEIHRTVMQDDRMTMRPIKDGVTIPPGAKIEFKPADYHIMLLGLNESLTPGMVFELEFEFELSGKIVTKSTVRTP